MKWRGLLIAAALLIVWEACYQAGLLNTLIFGAPSLIVRAAWSDGWVFLSAFRATLFAIAASISIAWSVGVSVGVLLGASRTLSALSAPVVSSLIAVPHVVLYPFFLAWLGLGPESKIAFGVVSGVFPIILSAMVGVRAIDLGFVRMARSMGASRLQVMTRVMAPLALPSILSGLRLGTALIVIGVVLAEMLGSVDGVGFWISYHRSLFNTGQVYLGIVLALVAAALANAVLSRIERRYARRSSVGGAPQT